MDFVQGPNVCGFCGSNGCNVKIKIKSTGFAKPFSNDFKYFRQLNLKSASKSTINLPYTKIRLKLLYKTVF